MTRLIARPLLSLAVVILLAAGTAAQGLPPAPSPESVGLSSERLARLTHAMRQEVEAGRVAGVSVLIVRGGKVAYFEPVGRADMERNVPMAKDTMFRIASMSKAVATVAAMILVEEGRLQLSDPVSRFIPAFARTTVAVPPPPGAEKGTYAVVPARREITIRDLMTHTAGLSYGTGSPAEAAYRAAGTIGWYLADQTAPIGSVVERIAALPFDAQPGERWVYGFGTDVLGAVVEKASGLTLDELVRTRITEPLQLPDTHFFVPQEKRDRVAAVYRFGADGRVQRAPDPGTGQGDYVEGPRTCFSGGAGLVSTMADYARFLQMLLNGGELDGVRLLGPKTIELMTSNHVGSLHNEGRTGFGLGFEVIEHGGRSGRPASVGSYGWGSAYGGRYWVDPREQLVTIFQIQQFGGGLELRAKHEMFTYQAIVGPPQGVAVAVPARRR
jgi:CubicO group peptidase (beta-lactamase class C family)